MSGIIGKKVGMTSIYDENGKNVACTVIEAGPCIVTQLRNKEADGYNAVQLSYREKKEKNTSKAMLGHFKRAGTTAKHKVAEFRNFRVEYEGQVDLGNSITVDQVFQENDFVDAIGTSKGKGFQGVVKRHGFAGVGQATHGQHNRLRAPGSIGAASFPSRVFKGMKMSGRMGKDKVTTLNLEVVKVVPEENLLLVKGPIPGFKGALVKIRISNRR